MTGILKILETSATLVFTLTEKTDLEADQNEILES